MAPQSHKQEKVSKRHIKRLIKYISKDEKGKLRKFLRKKKFDINTTSLFGDSMLLLACKNGSVRVVKYLIKKGANIMQSNDNGEDVFSSLAMCINTKKIGILVLTIFQDHSIMHCTNDSKTHFYQESILRKLKDYSSSMAGKGYDAGRSSNVESGDKEEDDYYTNEEDDEYDNIYKVENDSEGERKWNEKLYSALNDDLTEEMGRYSDEEGSKTYYISFKVLLIYQLFGYSDKEPNGDWFSDVYHEYRKRRQHEKYLFYKKLAEDKERRKPEERQFRKLNWVPTEKEGINEEDLIMKKLQYELSCSKLFSAVSKKPVLLKDIPWPMGFLSKNLDLLKSFLLSDLKCGSKKKHIRVQQVRWHPDRFKQRCSGRWKESEQSDIITKVQELSQLLNSLAENIIDN